MRLREPGAATAAITAADILRICHPFLVPGSSPAEPEIFASLPLSSIEAAEFSAPGSLTFVGPRVPLRVRSVLRAALILAEPGIDLPGAGLLLRVVSVHAAMAAVLTSLADRILRPAPFASGPGNRIAPGAVVEGCLEGDVWVGPGAHVGKGSFIGAGSRIEANAVIGDHCLLGRNGVVQSGAVIGCAGFGFFARPDGGLAAMPHLAGVEIGEEGWIGAKTVVAAGVLHPTSLGRGCKLDSHVQIAHNVRMGDDCLLASQAGIAGSTVAGHRLRMGGASRVDGHLRLGNDVTIAACSGVTKDWPDHSVVAGFPARPIREWRRQELLARKEPSRKGP